MKITSFRFWSNMQIEKDRLDRYTKDTILNIHDDYKYNVDGVAADGKIVDHVSWEFTSTISASVTVTHDSPRRFNYMEIISDLFKTVNGDMIDTFWFIEEVEGVESAEGIKYKATLDVFGTFGFDALGELQNKRIEVKRMHQDRYIPKDLGGGQYRIDINTNNISLTTSDFKIGETYGQTKTYQSAKQLSWQDDHFHTIFENDDKIGVIDNRVFTDYGVWYKYAVIEITGEPSYIKQRVHQEGSANDTVKITDFLNFNANRGLGIDGYRMIMPVGRLGGTHNGVYHYNSIQRIGELPDGKVVSLFLSPIHLAPQEGSVSYYLYMIFNSADNNTLKNKNLRELTDDEKKEVWFAMSFGNLDSDNNIELPLFNNTLKQSFVGTAQECYDFMKQDIAEIGQYHPEISPLEFMYKGDEHLDTTIDISKYLKNPKVVFRAMPDGSGSMYDINVADYHFMRGISNTQLTVITNASANYLNNNRYSIEAQKEGVKLQAKMQHLENKSQRASRFGGGIVGGFLSTINPSNWVAHTYDTKANGVIDEIADNNIAKIDAAAKDAASAAPSTKGGSGSGWSLGKTYEEEGIFTWKFRQPVKNILDRIIYHYNKFGYKTDNIINVPNDPFWYKTRSKFNFLQIENIKDYLGSKLNMSYVDESVMSELERTFKLGVRIWHQEDIVYDNENIELTIANILP